ncbi:hypothetical protein DAMA08_018960 [Martiniozyma asiatica (nom. inval.)]|nr:hypothetical protein DAMA08_018960 [Martiniozyma asiatica]
MPEMESNGIYTAVELQKKNSQTLANYIKELTEYNYLDDLKVQDKIKGYINSHNTPAHIQRCICKYKAKKDNLVFDGQNASGISDPLDILPYIDVIPVATNLNEKAKGTGIDEPHSSTLVDILSVMVQNKVRLHPEIVYKIYHILFAEEKILLVQLLHARDESIPFTKEDSKFNDVATLQDLVTKVTSEKFETWGYGGFLKLANLMSDGNCYRQGLFYLEKILVASNTQLTTGLGKYLINKTIEHRPELAMPICHLLKEINGIDILSYAKGKIRKELGHIKFGKKKSVLLNLLDGDPVESEISHIVPIWNEQYISKCGYMSIGYDRTILNSIFKLFPQNAKRGKSIYRERKEWGRGTFYEAWNSIEMRLRTHLNDKEIYSFEYQSEEIFIKELLYFFVSYLNAHHRVYLVVPLVQYVNEKYQIDISFESYERSLVYLVDNPCSSNMSGIEFFVNMLDVPIDQWDSTFCQNYIRLRSINGGEVLPSDVEGILSGMKWDGRPEFDLAKNNIHFKRNANGFYTAFNQFEDFCKGFEYEKAWEFLVNNEKIHQQGYEYFMREFARQGQVGYSYALHTSIVTANSTQSEFSRLNLRPNFKCLLNATIEAYSNPMFLVNKTNIIGLEILLDDAIRQDVKIEIEQWDKLFSHVNDAFSEMGESWNFSKWQRLVKKGKGKGQLKGHMSFLSQVLTEEANETRESARSEEICKVRANVKECLIWDKKIEFEFECNELKFRLMAPYFYLERKSAV